METFDIKEDCDDNTFFRERKSKEKPPLWNTFQDPPPRKASGSDASWTKLCLVLKLFKILIYGFLFLTILGSAVVSKISYLLMVAHTSAETQVRYCDIRHPGRELFADIPEEQRIAWIWAVLVAFASPEVFSFFRALRIYLFKDVKSPTWLEIFLVSMFEILHVIGLAVLTFSILPRLDSVRALMLSNSVHFVPALLGIFIGQNFNARGRGIVKFVLNIVCLVAQTTALFVWPAFSEDICVKLLAIPLILISFRWWENYICSFSNIAYWFKARQLHKSRYRTYLFLAPAKVLAFAATAFILDGQNFSLYFTTFFVGWNTHDIFVNQIKVLYKVYTVRQNTTSIVEFMTHSQPNAIVNILLCQIISSYLCYICAKFACKVKIQEFSFSLSLSIVGPVSVALTVVLVGLREADVCIFHNYVPDYLSLKGMQSFHFSDFMIKDFKWIWILWWVSQLWITHHIWYPKNDKNAPTEKLFVCPWYCAFLVDQCITMNRRKFDTSEDYLTIKNDAFAAVSPMKVDLDIVPSDKIPQLIVCATMWHETQDEMMEFLKSIVRMDEDQCARRMAKVHINRGNEDDEYYELETNIFFDDAFVLDDKHCENSKNPPLNEYVKLLINSIEKSVFEVYGVSIKIKPPVKSETPYGGRLVWTLPGRSKMIAHLKNKDKIRHKKRWSQVMYMYYLLGFRIMELQNASPKRKTVIAENTFILALDGDIDFQPQAVQLLIDRMKAIDELGAACGRIHPVGRGPMVWYQIFEYAIGHWLQKSTEHVIGCVLCSPGCFSLFRGSALMENSVMKKYTSVSEEPMHYVQYDQGEDRWLCTLILKQGLRVEYSAAADAYTHSPENFNEFYNQRRRWVPSTIANIFDLLSDADMVVKNNSSISMPYICYQGMLMVGTILGPGTIFLMMVGALVAVFNINIWTSFLWNFFPLLFFILSCLYLKQKYQLWLAFVISTAYCLVMMAVLIGIVIQIIEDGPFSPASLFFMLVFAQIFVAGLMHPQEASALICGFIYYITIPSMYMLLLIYSVFNMNDISWGTREVAARKDYQPVSEQKKDFLPGWMNDPLLVDSELGEVSLKEKRFWKDLINLYLKPMFHTKEKKAQIANSLCELRNMFAFAFVMINSIFVLIVFLLQLKKDYLHLEWPIDPVDFISYDETNLQVYVYRRYKELDPIGLCFVLFFGLILIIQFIAMFFHRFATVSQLLAATQIDWFCNSTTTSEEDAAKEIKGNAVNIARQLQRPKRPDDDYSANDPIDGIDAENSVVRRQTIFRLHENRDKLHHSDYSDLPNNFEMRFYGPDDIYVKNLAMSRKSIMMLNDVRVEAKRRLTTQTQRNTNFNIIQAYDNQGFEPTI